jgi:hypothetical protein
MDDGKAVARQRWANSGGGLLVVVHGIVAEVGAVYLLTTSIVATGIVALTVGAVTCTFLFANRRPA